MSVRQRKDILERLIKDFSDYSLPAIVAYSGYIKLVANPVLPRAIRKTYGNWTRAVKAVQIARPELFAPKVVTVEVKEVKAVPQPAPKPVKKPTVTTGK